MIKNMYLLLINFNLTSTKNNRSSRKLKSPSAVNLVTSFAAKPAVNLTSNFVTKKISVSFIAKSLLLFVQIISLQSFAWIMPAKTWIAKTAETSIVGPHIVENRATFTHGENTIEIKEKWFLENESVQTLVVTPADSAAGWKLVFKTAGNQRTLKMIPVEKEVNQKLEEQSLEKFLLISKYDSFMSLLIRSKILPKEAIAKAELPKTSKEIVVQTEPWSKLSRAGGVPSIMFSEGALEGSEPQQALWIDQDRFAVRQVLLNGGVQMTINEYTTLAKNKLYPQNRVILVGNTKADITLLSINPLNPKNKWVQNLKSETTLLTPYFDNLPIKDALFDFYMRSR